LRLGDPGADRGIDGVQQGVVEGNRLRQVVSGGILFEFDEDEDGEVERVLGGPITDLGEGGFEGQVAGEEIDIGHVEDLESGLPKQAVGIVIGHGAEAESGGGGGSKGLSEETAVGIGIEIQFDLADAEGGELLTQGAMGVGEAIGCRTDPGAEQGIQDGAGGDVIGVVGADHLALVESGWSGDEWEGDGEQESQPVDEAGNGMPGGGDGHVMGITEGGRWSEFGVF